ncbi:hypothetical protein B6D29_02220 [Microgenomates bacterium UTCPR1]|nr:MAG: hypothetical protein B6D29_02220 [Microgenomates bacterium UTCPR1]
MGNLIAPIPYAHIIKKFGENLQKIRRQKGISQEKLAATVGVHRTYIALLEQGDRNPSLRIIYRIAQALGVKSGELLSF